MDDLFLSHICELEAVGQCHSKLDFLVEHIENILDTVATIVREAPHDWLAHRNRSSSQGDALKYVSATSQSRVNDDLCMWILLLDSLSYAREYTDCARCRLWLQVASVRYPDGVCSIVHCIESIISCHDALDDQLHS